MKNFIAYSNPFISDIADTSLIYNLVSKIESCNGFYICTEPTVELSGIGTDAFDTSKVVTWYDSLASGNYLKIGTDVFTQSPTLILNDSQFNNKNCIDFNIDGSNKLLFNSAISVRTIIIVYLAKDIDGYLFYSPVVTTSINGNVYHDNFPPNQDKLWYNELRSNSSVFNSINRINGRQVDSDIFIPLNVARVLSISNIDNQSRPEIILGIGGRVGTRGGTLSGVDRADSVKGKIACILTFEDNLQLEKLQEIENELIRLFINYQGIVLTTTPNFKALLNTNFLFDFKTITIDEFFDITNYELISPLNIGLSLSSNGILSGVTNTLYNDKLKIKVTNSNQASKEFEFNLDISNADPIISSIYPDDIVTVLSANELYGLKSNSNKDVTIWEDARRLKFNTDVQASLPYFKYIPSTQGNIHNYIPPKIERYSEHSLNIFNNNNYVRFYESSKLSISTEGVSGALISELSGKSFVWVYMQTEGGVRNFLDSFPDIKGTGELWTVENIAEVHGQDEVTKLETSVNKLDVLTLSYKLENSKFYIIVATGDEDINFSSLINLKGYLAFFCSWSRRLVPNEINNLIKVLATRYYASDYPLVVSDLKEYRTQANIIIDLTKHIVDLKDRALTYNIVTNHYSAVISNISHTLTFTAIRDEVLVFVIDVTNSLGLTTRISLSVEIAIKTNQLYLAIRNIVPLNNITAFYILENESIEVVSNQISKWNDYRENSDYLTGTNVLISNISYLENKNAADFNIDGSSYFSISTSAISGKCFVLGYIRKPNTTNKAFLFGQDSDTSFASGNNGVFLDSSLTSSSILNSNNYINGYQVPNNYLISSELLNTVVINSSSNLSFNTIAKDRVFNDRSVKGYIPFICVFNVNINNTQALAINKAIRDYYDTSKFVTLMHVNNSLEDSSLLNKSISIESSNLSSIYEFSIKKFGLSSLALINNSQGNKLSIANNTSFAFLNEDFTVNFWISLNKALISTEVFTLFNISNLLLFIRGNQLIIGRNLVTPIYSTSIDLALYNQEFIHIQLVRKNRLLYLFINGQLTNSNQSIVDNTEYTDVNSPLIIGEFKNLSTTNVYYYIDEIAIIRRNALNTSNFTPTDSEYTIV